MTVLRCTAKLLKRLRQPEPAKLPDHRLVRHAA